MPYDLIIIGTGPAGLTSAIYAKRALLKTLLLEKEIAGGKLNKTAEVENYPGFTKISGQDLAKKITEHVNYYDNDWKNEEVIQLKKKKTGIFEIKTKDSTYSSQAVIISSGAVENKLKIPGEEEFTNFGVSYCAICDGFLFREKIVAVVGGGYSACEAALYLSNIASKVFLIHRSEDFRIGSETEQQIKKNPRINLVLNTTITEIRGKVGESKKIDCLILKNLQNKKEEKIRIAALFPCIGLSPYTNFFHDLEICNKQGYVLVDEKCATKIPGLFAAGDLIKPERIRQIVTAVADGAIAAQSAIEYLKRIQ